MRMLLLVGSKGVLVLITQASGIELTRGMDAEMKMYGFMNI